jgi:dihydropyrimidinase
MLIKNAYIINADESVQADILIKEGLITDIDSTIKEVKDSGETIDAKGLFVFPGGIDVHTHMELPVGDTKSSDDFESGTIAALSGGTTTIIDFTTPARGESLISSLNDRLKLVEKSYCDYSLHIGVTYFNEKTSKEIEECVKKGFTSFKIYMAYKDTIGLNDDNIIKVLETVHSVNALVMVHCENGDIIKDLQIKFISEGNTSPEYHYKSRPLETESEAVSRILTYAKIINTPVYIVHTSTANSVTEIERAKLSGQKVFAETCPQYLFLDESKYHLPGFESAKFVMSPPLRSKENQENLWSALNKGILDIVSTDHCPFNFINQKQKGIGDFTKIPNGAGGIENRLHLLYTYGVLGNKILLNKFVEITSTNPAKIFGLYPQKGTIKEGSDADLILWNPDEEFTINSGKQFQKCDHNIYEGFKIKGAPKWVIKRGETIFKDGRFIEGSRKCKLLFRK